MNKKYRKIFILVMFVTAFSTSFSQVYFRNLVYNRKSWYFELMGNGKYYSVNYEWLFKDYGVKQGIRGGAGVFQNFFDPNKPLCVTANVEYVAFWLHRYHHIEWGGGATYRYEMYKKTWNTTGYTVTHSVPPVSSDTTVYTISHSKQVTTTGPIFVGRIGYRYQDPNGGLMFRIGWTPMFYMFNKEKTVIDGTTTSVSLPLTMKFLYFGASVGWNFY